jgi:hypothetical protein
MNKNRGFYCIVCKSRLSAEAIPQNRMEPKLGNLVWMVQPCEECTDELKQALVSCSTQLGQNIALLDEMQKENAYLRGQVDSYRKREMFIKREMMAEAAKALKGPTEDA